MKNDIIKELEDIDLNDYYNIKNIRVQVDKILFHQHDVNTFDDPIHRKIYKNVIENNLKMIKDKSIIT